jgi:DNA-binding NtrC family response regulator
VPINLPLTIRAHAVPRLEGFVFPDVSASCFGAGVDREVVMPREYSDLYLGVDCVPMPAIPSSDSRPPSPHEIIPMLIGSTVEAIERELVLQTLARCHGNRTHAARLLGLSVRTMRNKIRQYGTDGTDTAAHN